MQRIGRYEVLQELGRGAMGAVYKARDPQIGRTVAIKRILTTGLSHDELAQYKMRFSREAQAAGQMSHPGIVTIHDISEDDEGQPFLVMEFVEGATLHHMLRPDAQGRIANRLPLAQSLDIAAQVADALDYAHRRSVVHRDVKPANILVTPEGRAKIADFGIAKFSGAELTQTAHMMGTPSYMAPEQFRGGMVDARTDIFSLGAMLYWMTTGVKPFTGDALTIVSFNVVFTEQAPPCQVDPALPADLDIVISRCLAKSPEHRYAAARELAGDLQALKAGRAVRATPAPKIAPVDDTLTMSATATLTPGAPLKAPQDAGDKTLPPVVVTAKPVTSTARHTAVFVGVAVLLSAGAFWIWTSLPAESPDQPAASTQVIKPPSAQPGSPGSSAAPPAATSPSSADTKAAANSTLAVDCRHNFKEARLEIFSGKRRILDEKLAGESAVFGRTSGKLNKTVPLQAGEQTLRVRVTSAVEKDKYEEEKEIKGELPEGGAKVLIIEFGKGSGAGFAKRKLALRWK